MCSDVFEMGSDGKSKVKKNDNSISCIDSAVAGCPVQAISK
jgi:ferredoxin